MWEKEEETRRRVR